MRQPSRWSYQGWKLGIAIAFGISGVSAFSQACALAQNITLDGTIGPAQTLIRNGQTYDIPQGLGQTVGTNLFQSFGQFNLDAGERASFESDSSIRNILSRVTGGFPSVINGEIFTQSPNVNLFFINPYGIVFGPNASLDVGLVERSAFVATTVDALVWPNGGQFSATNPQGPSSLLTLVGDPGGFLSLSRPPGAIANLGGNLSVYDNQSLVLLGGNVSLDGGELNAQGGRVEIGAVGGAGTVGLEVGSDALSLNFTDDIARADVSLSNGAKINATTGQGNDNGIGNIRIQARAVSLTNGAQLDASTYGQQDAGVVVVDATDTVVIAGQNTFIRSDVESGAEGNAGGIGITAGSFFLTDNAQLITNTAGVGNAGIVVVQADQVVL
ncbi:MAG: filamentous hemagglutinin N-terminal domain-containing protein, partial [Cyanobacteriota bacterium]